MVHTISKYQCFGPPTYRGFLTGLHEDNIKMEGALKRGNYRALLTLIFNCFLAAAMKQRLRFVFLCCLFLTSITVLSAHAQVAECLERCDDGAESVRRLCRTLPDPVIRRSCFNAAERGRHFADETASA